MKVLILDDAEETDLAIAEKATTDLGYAVDGTPDPARFRVIAREERVDLQIVDHSLSNAEERVGLRDGPEVVAVTAAEAGLVPTIFLTNWGADCARRMAELDPRLVYIIVEKPTSLDFEDWKDKIRHAIHELESQPAPRAPEPLGILVADMDSEFFRVSAQVLHTLTEDDRDSLEARANLELHDRVLPVWAATDADWLMLQRIGDTVLVTDRGSDDALPTVDAVFDAEEDRGWGALIMGRPTIVEETLSVGLVDCSPPNAHRDWRRYTYVRLSVGDHQREFHLDTGSPASFISRELLDEASFATPRLKAKSSQVRDLGGRKEVLFQLPIDVLLHVDGPEGNVALSARLQAVKNWKAVTMLNPRCSGQRCPASQNGQCGRRLGLMGRDLLYHLPNGVWQFQPRSGQFYPLPS